MVFEPMITKKTREGIMQQSLSSKAFDNRTIFIFSDFNDDMAYQICIQLMLMDSDNPNNEDIDLYICSPGGSVNSGMVILDTIGSLKCKVNTYCLGSCASMGAFLLAHGTGKRYAGAHSEIMIHQPSGGFRGQASDIIIHADNIARAKKMLNARLAKATNQEYDVVYKATERDNFMTAKEALEFGVIDEIIDSSYPSIADIIDSYQ